jgi:hypothetical protein
MGKWRKRTTVVAASIVALFGIFLIGSAVHLFPQLRNPFGQTTTERSQPVVLKSIVDLSKYEAASGNFQVVVDITSSGLLPSFLQGSDTLFIGVGADNAYVDFSHLKGTAVQVSADRLTATLTLPHAQLDPAVLDVKQSYVFAQQQGLFTRLNSFLSGNPNSQQAVYELAQTKIEQAAAQSAVKADAERNTRTMLVSLLQSLGFKTVTVTFA